MCITLSDGINATKQAFVTEDLEETVREAPLYSLLKVKSATVIDGCMIQIEEMEVKDEKYSQAVILNKELNLLAKDFFERVILC